MTLGVLEDRALEHVPGTVYIYDDESQDAARVEQDRHSKRDKTGKIILVPQVRILLERLGYSTLTVSTSLAMTRMTH